MAGSVGGRSSRPTRSVSGGRAGSVLGGRSERAGSVAGTVLEGHSKKKTTMEVVTSTSGQQRQHISVCLRRVVCRCASRGADSSPSLYESNPRAYYAGWAFLILIICGAIVAVGVSQSQAARDYES